MSTNFYAVTPDTAPGDEGLHIGQHAAGNEFLFRAHPELGLTNCDAWYRYLSQGQIRIIAEYGVEESLTEFWRDATLRPADVGGPNVMRSRWRGSAHRKDEWTDDHGHPFANYEFC